MNSRSSEPGCNPAPLAQICRLDCEIKGCVNDLRQVQVNQVNLGILDLSTALDAYQPGLPFGVRLADWNFAIIPE